MLPCVPEDVARTSMLRRGMEYTSCFLKNTVGSAGSAASACGVRRLSGEKPAWHSTLPYASQCAA